MRVFRRSGWIVCMALWPCALPCVAAGMDTPSSLEALVAAVEPATLVIYGTDAESGAPLQGTGVSIDDSGLILATAHQVAGASDLRGANEDFRCDLEVIAWDTTKDLALLRADPPVRASVPLGDAEPLAKGASVFVLSAPAGMRLTLTTGSIATTGLTLHGQPRLQVDMALAGGASGGPVFDREGRLVGIVSARAEGLEGFTIVTPVNEAYSLLDMHGVGLPEGARDAFEATPFEEIEPPAAGDDPMLAAITEFNRGVAAAPPREKIRHYETAVRYAEDFFEAWFNLGTAHAALGENGAAAEAYRQAHLLRPESGRVLRNYGQALLKAGDAPGALRVLGELIGREPDDARIHNDMGEAHRRMGAFEEAERAFREALSLDAEYAPAHYNLALVWVQMERRDEAIGGFERYLALRPDADDAKEVREAIQRLRKDLP